MSQLTTTVPAPALPSAWHSLCGALVATWRRLGHDLLDSYRPERHYMRGPGPKWREKHGRPGGSAAT